MGFSKPDKYILDYEPDIRIPRGLLAYVWWVIKRNPVFWVLQIFFDLVHATRYPLSFYLVGVIIDQITALPEGAAVPDSVWMKTGAIFAILFFGELCHAIPHYWAFDWWKRARAELRSDLFAYTLNHSYTYFQNHFAGSIARKISEGIEKALVLNEQIRWQILLPLTLMTSSSLILFQVSAVYGAMALGFVFLILFPVFLKLKKLTEKSRIYADRCSDVTGQIVDTLTNMPSVKSYAHEEREMEEHRHVSEAQMKAWHKMLRAFLMLDNYRRFTLAVFGAGMMAALSYWLARRLSEFG